jgi:radical SAM protein with 4Fe4S-binding SPASM domain
MYRIGVEKSKRDELPEKKKKFFLAARDNLYVSQRDLKVLVLDGETTSWMVMPQSEFYFLQQLKSPRFAEQFVRENDWVPPRQLMDLAERFHSRGLLDIDARGFQHFTDMWKQPPQTVSTFFIELDTVRENAAARVQDFDQIKLLADRLYKDYKQEDFMLVLSCTNLAGQWDHLVRTIIHFNELGTQNKSRPHYVISSDISEVGEHELEYAINQKISFVLRVGSLDELRSADSRKIIDLFNAEKASFSLDVRLSEPSNLMAACQTLREREVRLPRLNFTSFENLLDPATGVFIPGRVEEFGVKYSEVFGQAIEQNKTAKAGFLFSDLNFMIECALVNERRNMCMQSPCGAGRSILAFDTDGFIYPCDTMIGIPQLALGNLREIKTIPEAVEASPVISDLRKRKNDSISKCSGCHWRHFCNGGCPTQSFKAFGNLKREDPFCRFYQAAYEDILWHLAEEPATMSLQDLIPPPSRREEETHASPPQRGENPAEGRPF